MKKNLLLLLLALLSTVSSWAYNLAAENDDGVTIYYNILYTASGKELEVTYESDTYNSYSGNVVIPDRADYMEGNLRVTKIGKHAFEFCPNLTAVTIPNSVTSIDMNAFSRTGLTSVTIPDGVTELGENAFSYTQLSSVIVPESVTTIGTGAFGYNSNLTSLTLPESVNFIGYNLVEETPLQKDPKNWEDGVLYIGSHLIRTDDSLSGKYVVKNGTKCIAGYAFRNATEITDLVLPASVTGLSLGAFSFCKKLASVTVKFADPADVKAPEILGVFPFDKTTAANAKLYVPKGTKDLFATRVTWERFAEIIEFGDYDFCEKNDDDMWMFYNINKNGYQVTVTYQCEDYDTYYGDVVIPEEVTHDGKTYGINKVGDSAFYDCPNLTSVSIPEGVISVGSNSFRNCSALKDVKFPSTIYQIGDYSFIGAGLESLILPDKVTKIGYHAFSDCSKLTNIRIPRWCLNIEEQAFAWCPLKVVTIEVQDPSKITLGNDIFYAALQDNSVYLEVPKDSKTAYESTSTWSSFKSAGGIKELGYHIRINNGETPIYYTINDDDKSVAVSYRFDGEKSYTDDVEIPATINDYGGGKNYDVTGVSTKAFYACNTMTSVKLPESVTYIDNVAFLGCLRLNSIVLPSALTTIGDDAFKGCSTLKSVEMGENIESIGKGAFSFCQHLEEFSVNVADPADIQLGASVFANSIGSNTTLYVPEESIELYSEADQWKDFAPRIAVIGSSGIDQILDDTDSAVSPITDGIYYDLMGRRVTHPTRGIYILNGRKVLVK